MTEIDAIMERHSVRNYTNKKIEQEKIDLINELIAMCNEEGNLHLQFCADAGNTFNRLLSKAMGLGSAPSVIACVGPDDATVEERIGYYGEKIVLFAQQLGLNTCWAGTFKDKGGPFSKVDLGIVKYHFEVGVDYIKSVSKGDKS